MPAPASVQELVRRFDEHLPAYKSGQYKETQLRIEFLDPLFVALGWDVHNSRGYDERYKDVVHEDEVRVAGERVTKAPDYAFRIGGVRKFFLEAKKPAVDIHQGRDPAYQLRRYAWSAKLPLSILSDFEEFAVYDTRIQPKPGDPAHTARVLYLRYTDYETRWDEIAGLFSPESIMRGAFDKYVESNRAKRGTAEVDAAFLAEIERWRELLAENIARRNPALGQRDLNYAVQQTLDRTIFLRIGEDRGLEPYGSLLGLTNGPHTYERLVQLFRQADHRYNSGLFHFEKERGQATTPDLLTPGLRIDDKPLRDILKSLYYPDSPYEFSVLPADILGQIYERFLGKVVRLAPGRRVVVEEKPEVKKAGGVYYTPTYIVDTIVQRTVGSLLEGRTPGPKGTAAGLRIVDPACGSGSFLLGAYEHLLNWHLNAYLADPERWARGRSPRLYRDQRGGWRLTVDERKRILLDNLYGVDIDAQAVEVTKLSLLLKVLEGEDRQSLDPQLALLPERVLPDLGRNIRCGNSLIGPEFYDGRQMELLDEEEADRVNAFDWRAAFPQVMAAGGFDAVIGNPPYIRIQTMKEWAPLEVEVYKQRYRAAGQGNYDIYVVFIEKGLELLNEGGRLGFIVPHKFFNAKYGAPLRRLIAEGKHLAEVVHFGDQQVFKEATTYTCLLFLTKKPTEAFEFVRPADIQEWQRTEPQPSDLIPAEHASAAEWNFSIGQTGSILGRLSELATTLGDISRNIFQGLVTSSDKVYLLDPADGESGDYIRVFSRATSKEYELESGVLWPLCKGSRDIRRYQASPSKWVLFPYDPIKSKATGKTVLIPQERFATEYPRAWSYLQENSATLRGREKGKMDHAGWYGYVYPKSVTLFAEPKIITPSIASHSSFMLDREGRLYFVGSGGGGGGGYGIVLREGTRESYAYILGLLNSKLLDTLLKRISSQFRGGYYAYSRQYIEQLPIRTIDFSDPADVRRHDEVAALVEQLLALHRRRAAAQTPHARELAQRQIDAADRRLDGLVYALYGLSEAEIALVEGAGG